MQNYPIGTPGKPWGEEEKEEWKQRQTIKRSYNDEVLKQLGSIPEGFELKQYGALPYDESRYPLYAVTPEGMPKDIDATKLGCINIFRHTFRSYGIQRVSRLIVRQRAILL